VPPKIPDAISVLLLSLFAVGHAAATPPPPETTSPESLPLLKPPALAAGATLGLLAPASPVGDRTLEQARRNLTARGYRVQVAPNSRARLGYLAGSDAQRVEDLHAFFRDPSIDAIICLRGGYGSPRLLDVIDYDLVRRHPKILVGYSDITALGIALQRRTGLIVFHGPMAVDWQKGRGLSPFAEHYYWPLFQGTSDLFANWGAPVKGMRRPKALHGGRCEGRLTGGNLSVVCSTMGTPYEIDTRDAILFLEDVSEKLFRIDRMLNQLRLAGKLGECRGILLGRFAGCEESDGGVSRQEVFEDYLLPLGIPVLVDYPAGHVADHAVLPLGIRVRLDADNAVLSLLESPVAVTNTATPTAGK
jgi:muramoyltetrapeptide carboxypeptidase